MIIDVINDNADDIAVGKEWLLYVRCIDSCVCDGLINGKDGLIHTIFSQTMKTMIII
jgi:hypothetical protein